MKHKHIKLEDLDLTDAEMQQLIRGSKTAWRDTKLPDPRTEPFKLTQSSLSDDIEEQ